MSDVYDSTDYLVSKFEQCCVRVPCIKTFMGELSNLNVLASPFSLFACGYGDDDEEERRGMEWSEKKKKM